MKRIGGCLAAALAAGLLLTSCGLRSVNLQYTLGDDSAYSLQQTIQPDGAFDPVDLVWTNQSLVVTDGANDRLMVWKPDGSIRYIGGTGNGPGEFLAPAGIAADQKGQIYVVDSKNQRIQVLDSDFKYVKAISLDGVELNPHRTYPLGVAVDANGVIYLTVKTERKKEAFVYRIDDTGAHKILSESTGVVCTDGETAYFANTYELTEDAHGYIATTGNHRLVRFDGGKAAMQYPLPDRYAPRGLVANGNSVYASSASQGTVDCFDLASGKGKMVYFQPQTTEKAITFGSLCMDGDQNIYLIIKNRHCIEALAPGAGEAA